MNETEADQLDRELALYMGPAGRAALVQFCRSHRVFWDVQSHLSSRARIAELASRLVDLCQQQGLTGELLDALRDANPEDYPRFRHWLEEETRVAERIVFPTDARLTPQYLLGTIGPYVKALVDLQRVIDEIRGEAPHEVEIQSIRQRSPISVDVKGASDAIQTVRDMVVPWRRDHAKTMADLIEQEKRAEIEVKKAEILEKRATAEKNREEADRLAAEAAKLRQEAEQMRLENEKAKLELYRARIQLALDLVAQINPGLPEADRISFVIKLLPPLDVLIRSELEPAPPAEAGQWV